MTSFKKPTNEQVRKALAAISKPNASLYFFSKLENPEWLAPLRKNKVFRTPPKAVQDKESDLVTFPVWPAMRYLRRMVTHLPELVAEILLEMEPTDNPRVNEEIIEIVIDLPIELSSTIIRSVSYWDHDKWMPQWSSVKLSELVGLFAEKGFFDDADYLARELWAVEKDTSEENSGLRTAVRTRLEQDHWYAESINTQGKKFIECAPEKALSVFSDILNQYLYTQHEEGPPSDYSHVWRPAIEDHLQNEPENFEDALVKAVRTASESVVKIGTKEAIQVAKDLEARKWNLFRRISIYLLGYNFDNMIDYISDNYVSVEMLEDYAIRHEYIFLLRSCFAQLPKKTKEIYYNWIETGPSDEMLIYSTEREADQCPTAEELQTRRDVWQRDRLSWIADHLSNNWRERYGELVELLGEPEHPEFPFYVTSGWAGPESPIDDETLEQMKPRDLLAFLANWVPPKKDIFYGSPTPHGLSRTLSRVVARRLSEFSQLAFEFKALRKTYLRALIDGTKDGFKNSTGVDWAQILELCIWVVSHEIDPIEENADDPWEQGEEYTWNWTRKSIASFIGSIVSDDEHGVPFELRDLVWASLEPLTNDPDPTLEIDENNKKDSIHLSINSTRGEAYHSVFKYSLWVKRKMNSPKEDSKTGFDVMPEVRSVLECGLKRDERSRLAVHAVYGQWFPWSQLLDRDWALENIERIFPPSAIESDYWYAAWSAYVRYCDAYSDVYPILEDKYLFAVEKLATSVSEQPESDSSNNGRLAGHLMIHYWRGNTETVRGNKLIDSFFENASPSLRGTAIGFIGRSLENTKVPVESAVAQRLTSLWSTRVAVNRTLSQEDRNRELSAFGWWFSSGKLDDKWMLENLELTLSLSETIEDDWHVVERLEALSDIYIVPVLRCLTHVLSKTGTWINHRVLTSTARVLEIAKNSKEPSVAQIGLEIADILGERGHHEFKDIRRELFEISLG